MLLVDTGVFLGVTDRTDGKHARASALIPRIASERPFTTDHVVIESWGLILRRSRRQNMSDRFLAWLRTAGIRIETTLAVDLERAISIGELWPNANFDLVDRTSFAVMERLGCRRAATFDPDFAVYRTGPDRKIAFEVVN